MQDTLIIGMKLFPIVGNNLTGNVNQEVLIFVQKGVILAFQLKISQNWYDDIIKEVES